MQNCDSYLALLFVKAADAGRWPSSGTTRTDLESLSEKCLHLLPLKRLGYARTSLTKLVRKTDLVSKWSRYFVNTEGLTPIYKVLDYLMEVVEDTIRRMSEFFEIFNLTWDPRELERWRHLLQFLSIFDGIIPQMKLATNVAFCDMFDLERPDLYPGALGVRFFPRPLRLRLKQSKKYGHRMRVMIFLNSLFQGLKKGLMPAMPDSVDQSLKKHCTTLGTKKDMNDGMLSRAEELLSDMSREFGGIHDFSWNAPISRKSTYDSSYANGGNVGFLRDRYYGLESLEDDRKDLYYALRVEHFVGYARRGVEVREVRSRSLHRWDLLCMAPGFRDLKFIVSPACILEPMKVRIITKPYQGLHLGLTQLQKWLWRKLRYHPTNFFRLIGEPLGEEALWPILNDWRVGKKFVSGDYAAATDNLKMDITQMAYQKIFGFLEFQNPRLYYRGLRSLTDCEVDYSKAVLPKYPFPYAYEARELGTIKQKNGQLMGNVLSFVLLCVANYVSYHISRETVCNKRLPLWNVDPVLINGDDILFCSTDEHYEIWNNTVKEFGLMPSVGKNFFTDRLLQINSELWIPTLRVYEDLPAHIGTGGVLGVVTDVVKVPYVNFGLLTQRRKQDCSLDLSMVSAQTFRDGVSACLDGGDPSSWIIRLRNIVTIKKSLMADLPDSLRLRVLKIFNTHVNPILESCGLLRFVKYGDWYLDKICRLFVKRSTCLALQCFPECEEEKLVDSFELDRALVRNGRLPYFGVSTALEVETEWEREGPCVRCPDGDLEGYFG